MEIEAQDLTSRQRLPKKPIVIIIICSMVIISFLIVVCSLLVFSSSSQAKIAKTTSLGETSSNEIVSPTEKQLQLQVNDLLTSVSDLNNTISQLKSQIKTTEAFTTPPADQQAINTVNDLTSKVTDLSNTVNALQEQVNTLHDNLSTNVNTLEEQVKTLQESLSGNVTNIGTTSMSINGLSVTFITNNIEIGMTGSTTAGTAQFAIKIANLTSSVVSNVDVTGTLTSSQYIAGNMVAGYPQVTDGAALSTITYSYTGDKTVNFEAYGGTKSLSIPVGGSITIRPKISILATANNKLAATTFTIAVNAITYDVGVAK